MIEKNNRFYYVDLMRGIAIFLVVFVHTSQFYKLGDELLVFSKYGQLGVQLFFVASAYTLCLSMSNVVDLSTYNIKHFYIRRYFRIAPLYYIGIGMYFCINYVLSITKGIDAFEFYNFKGILSNLLLLHSFFPKYNNTIVPGGWSIATEIIFYILFPYLFSFVKSYSFRKVIFFIIIYTLIHLFILNYAGEIFQLQIIKNNSFYYFSIVNQFPVFLFGIAMFKIINKGNIKKDAFLCLLLLSLFLIVLIWQFNRPFSFVLIPVFAGSAFLSLGTLLSTVDFRFRLIELLGKLSYSIYIFHFVFSWYLIVLIDREIGFLSINIYLLFLVYLFITLFFSVLIGLFTEKYIERYFIEMGKKIIKKQ